MSFWHLVLLFLILLMVMGPSKIEGIGISLGKAIRGFKKGLQEGEDEIRAQQPPATTQKQVTTQTTIEKTTQDNV
jgi:sec-independent protein translocase protein TatA